MPIYEYECTRCGHQFEEERSFSAPPRQRCPRCRGRVQKLVSQPAILFKGSGFYATDSRRENKRGKATPADAGSSSDTAPAAVGAEPTAPGSSAPGKGAAKPEKPATAGKKEKKTS